MHSTIFCFSIYIKGPKFPFIWSIFDPPPPKKVTMSPDIPAHMLSSRTTRSSHSHRYTAVDTLSDRHRYPTTTPWHTCPHAVQSDHSVITQSPLQGCWHSDRHRYPTITPWHTCPHAVQSDHSVITQSPLHGCWHSLRRTGRSICKHLLVFPIPVV